MFSSSSQFEINSLIGQDRNQITDPNHNFPSLDRNGFNELLHAIQAVPTIPNIPEQPPELQLNPKDSGNGRKRSIRRDRHSKIVTAKGPRDRRMRLSLDVAKKFFDLQDVLGFDKASKTVDWLLSKSKDAIKSLSGGGSKSEHKGSSSCGNWKIESSSTSECEVDSANPVEEERIGQFAGAGEITHAQINKSIATRVSKKIRKVNSDPIVLKESRAKARERARERTREKMTMMMKICQNGVTEVENQQNNVQPKIPNTSILESAGDQSFPMMMMREIYTSADCNKSINCDDQDDEYMIDKIDPYSLYQEFWNSTINPSSTVNDQD